MPTGIGVPSLRSGDLGGVEQAAAVVRREADGLAVADDGGGLDELAVGGVGPAVAVGLEVGEQRPQGGQLAADGAVGLATGGGLVTPLTDVLGPHLSQMLQGTCGDPGMGEKLMRVVLVGLAGVGVGVRNSQASTARVIASRGLSGTCPPAKYRFLHLWRNDALKSLRERSR